MRLRVTQIVSMARISTTVDGAGSTPALGSYKMSCMEYLTRFTVVIDGWTYPLLHWAEVIDLLEKKGYASNEITITKTKHKVKI
jgi:hypothetical protein